jgi:hypothetical protein
MPLLSAPARQQDLSRGEELVRYPPDAPASEQARLLRRGAHYLIETEQGRVRLTPRQAEVLVSSVSYFELCRDEALVRLRWQVMSVLGIDSDGFERAFFYQSFEELGGLRPVEAFEQGRDNEILELARALARRWGREPSEPEGRRQPTTSTDEP